MPIACLLSVGRGETDRILAAAAAKLETKGLRLAGLVQTNPRPKGQAHCDMDVRVLGSDLSFRISQSLGREARGCRLDTGALVASLAAVERSLTRPVDAMILNKFGKVEAEGGGLRPVIAEAMMRDLPIVLGVNGLNLGALSEFLGDAPERLPQDEVEVAEWITRHAAAQSRQSVA